MLREKITYTDYNGNERTEEFYFNLSKVDLINLTAETGGEDLTEMLQKVGSSGDGKLIYKTFNRLMEAAYGIKSEDGRRLIKGPDVWKEFTETPAYEILLTRMLTDSKYASTFVNSIISVDKPSTPRLVEK